MTSSIREALESAISTTETAQSEPAQGTTPVPASESSTPSTASPTSEVVDRPRGPDGKFIAKSTVDPSAPDKPIQTPNEIPAPAQAAAAASQAVADEQAAANRRAMRAPASLTPEEREAWAQVPAPLQQAFLRREQEVQRALQETAGARQFASVMSQIVEPVISVAREQGIPAVQYMQNLVQASVALHRAPPAHKAQIVAEIIKQFGVDIEMLDSALVGVVPQGQNPAAAVLPQVQQIIQQQLAPFQQLVQNMHQVQQAAIQRTYEEAQAELAEMAGKPEFEFLDDVRGMMATLMEAAAQEGREISYKEAYEAATLLHPGVKSVIMQRQQAQTAQALAKRAAAAKAASVSTTGAPAVGAPDDSPRPGESIRATLERVMAANSAV